MIESKLLKARTYIQEHFEELSPEMKKAVEELLKITEPPEIEYIDDKHLKFDNLTSFKESTGYYKKSLALHQYVWIFHNGEIQFVS